MFTQLLRLFAWSALAILSWTARPNVSLSADPALSAANTAKLITRTVATASVAPAANPLVSTGVSSNSQPIAGQRLSLEDASQVLTAESAEAALPILREVYVWAWPMVSMSNLKRSLGLVRGPGVSGGAPVASVNSLCMLTNVIDASFRSVPCPNRDVIYGFGLMDLTHEPVVVQVPDFGDRFWLYQVGDHRMEAIAQFGSTVGTAPGLYLIAGPNWEGVLPDDVRQVYRSSTNLAYIMPRILVGQDGVDERLSQSVRRINMYPLSRKANRWRETDWDKTRRWYPVIGHSSRERSRLVVPARFFDDLRNVLTELTPSPKDDRMMELARSIVRRAEADPTFAASLSEIADRIEQETIVPMFDFRALGDALPGHWRTISNGAAFGEDYWTRTAVAKSNPFVNLESEAKYYYLEQNADGSLLDGNQNYELRFPAGALPSHGGFWSITVYDQNHNLVADADNRHALGSLTRDLQVETDGSIVIRFQSQKPTAERSQNWLATPSGRFVIYLRVYAPSRSVLDGSWHPPAVDSQREAVLRSPVAELSAR